MFFVKIKSCLFVEVQPGSPVFQPRVGGERRRGRAAHGRRVSQRGGLLPKPHAVRGSGVRPVHFSHLISFC